jgi:hypothetical protein
MPIITSLFSALERLGSEPRDLYTFARSDTMWRHTSSGRAITVTYPGPHDVAYAPGVIERGAIQRGTETGALKVHVKVARTMPVAAALREYRVHPMVCGIHRYQQDPTAQPVLQAYGDVAGVTLNEGWVEFDLVSAEAMFDQPFPRMIFSATCTLATYGARCGVDETAFSTAATITAIDGSTVTVDAVPTVADEYYDSGQILIPSTRERLFVASRSGVGLLDFQIFGPVPDGIVAGEPVVLIAGDDQSLATCKAKFDNVPNFFGFNDLPITDPMQTGFTA